MLIPIVVQVCLLVMVSGETLSNARPKCFYNETVDLRNYESLSNGSYLYRDILIEPEKLAFYEYRIKFLGRRVKAERHLRGCICDTSKRRYCINLCCEVGETYNKTSTRCEPMPVLSSWPMQIPMVLMNGTKVNVALLDHFVYKVDLPCKKPEWLLIENEPWELNEDGILQILEKSDAVIDDYADLGTVSYCITPYLPNSTKNYVLAPMSCPIKNEKTFLMTLNTYSMTVSVIFLIPTIIIYILLKSLRSSISGRM
uniref:Methuselah N-terminal domain-containing protein n=1 Tax=Stomoxys calcitrans TaxID=35570 RepID=A0A1I8PKT7_STOCA